jgi:hypothetical protein
MVIVLYVKFSKVQQLEHEYRSILEEAEAAISSFVLELKEENEAFLEKISSVSDRGQEHPPAGETAGFDEQEDEISKENVRELLRMEESVSVNNESQESDTDFDHWSTTDQVVCLKEQGYSMEEIAKKLHKGKTEIELLWKFRQGTPFKT